ncbi:MAG: histidinol dehydrogenase [Terriglobia bacterium]
MLKIIRSQDEKALRRLFQSRRERDIATERVVCRIMTSVKRHGDAALIRLARRLDRTDLIREGFTVTPEEIRAAYGQVPKGFAAALERAARNIRGAAKRQLPKGWMTAASLGVHVGQVIRPLDRVACYVPGGRFPLPSTVLMGVIPAQAAGVKDIVVTSPRPAPAVCVAADLLGVKKIYRLGGAQAIAAFAYGTESVPRADKVVGPGNRYVAAAKKLVSGECGIDFIAGPTELVVVGSKGRAAWIAADLVAQAEHDTDACAIFITSSMRLALQVQKAARAILARLRLPVAEASLHRQGAIILTANLSQSVDLANRLAPEHLTLLDDAAPFVDQIRCAGAIFLGAASAVAAGDYASGGNHILPTAGAARVRGGLTTADFVRSISVQRLSLRGLANLRSTIVTLADAEGLSAHAHSVEARFQDDPRA